VCSSDLSILSIVQAAITSTGSTDEQSFVQKYEEWLIDTRKLQQQVNDQALSLPPYDVRKAQTAIDDCVLEIERCKAKMLPRKKFAFKNHASRGERVVGDKTLSSSSISSSSLGVSGGEQGGEMSIEQVQQLLSSVSTSSTPNALRTNCTVEGEKGRLIVLDSSTDSSFSSGRDVHLLNLEDCTVAILEPINALRIDGLTNCNVVCASIRGSALLHACTGSSFFLSTRQIRIHTSTQCDFYIQVLSRPIIEHCNHLRFAPFEVLVGAVPPPLQGESGAHAVPTSARPPAQSALWAQVDDFNWHRAQASPHWSVLPESERVGHQGLRADVFERVSKEIRFANNVPAKPALPVINPFAVDEDEDDEEL
jgi:hypothetical protein